MDFCIANVLRRMRPWFTPISFPGSASVYFSPTVRVCDFDLSLTEEVDDASGMRMHRLFFSRLKPIFDYSDVLIVEQDFVVLGR
jgi:hypothetical protein